MIMASKLVNDRYQDDKDGKDETDRPFKKMKQKKERSASPHADRDSLVSPSSFQGTNETERRARRPNSSTFRHVEFDDPDLDLRDKLTSEEGQLEENPYYTPEQAREAAKREYNRRNAARARLRRKCLLSEMQEKCALMDSEMKALKKENAALKAELQEMKLHTRALGLDGSTSSISSAGILQQERDVHLPQIGRAIGADVHLPQVDRADLLTQERRMLADQSLMNDGSTRTSGIMNISQPDRVAHLPQLGESLAINDLLLRQRQILAQQSLLSGLGQQQSIILGGIPTVVPPHGQGDSSAEQLMQSLILARARAALHPNNDLTGLTDSTLQEFMRRKQSSYYPPK